MIKRTFKKSTLKSSCLLFYFYFITGQKYFASDLLPKGRIRVRIAINDTNAQHSTMHVVASKYTFVEWSKLLMGLPSGLKGHAMKKLRVSFQFSTILKKTTTNSL